MTVFHATIVASSDEQDTPIEDWNTVKLNNFPFLSKEEDVDVIVKNEELPPPDQDELDFHKN
ncbi:MAG: hypothetical protein GX317_09785 [Staphylococcus equorum]|nr:hypothetical protein [Staphylococcus equorum]